MTRPAPAPRAAAYVIRTACRALPHAERTEREAEWTAEAEAITGDTGIRLPTLRALWFAFSLLLHVRATRSSPRINPALANRLRTRKADVADAADAADVAALVAALVAAFLAGLVGVHSVVFGLVSTAIAVSVVVGAAIRGWRGTEG